MKRVLALWVFLNEQLNGRDYHLTYTPPNGKTSGNYNSGVIYTGTSIFKAAVGTPEW